MGVRYRITNNQAHQLEGVRWVIDDECCYFATRTSPRENPWFAGAEGRAYPLETKAGIAKYFVKFQIKDVGTAKRMKRMQWFIDQAVFTWAPELVAAPCRVLDTRRDGRPDGINFDFCCVLSQAVSGMSWTEAKGRIMEGTWTPTHEERMRWVDNLIRSLAILERNGIRHGDISPNNVMVECSRSSGDPSLKLIDFDGFVATDARELCYLLESEGGTIGTDGYYAPEFDAMRQRGVSCIEYKSDRYARDMLILELLLYNGSWAYDKPISECDRDKIRTLLRSRSLSPGLRHLGRGDVFESKQDTRPQSTELAQHMALAIPPRRKGTSDSSSVPAASPLSTWAATVIWSCCFGVWIVISFMFVRLLAPGAATGLAYMGQILARMLLFGASVTAGGTFLTFRIVCSDRPQTYRIGGVLIELPRRRTIRQPPLNQWLRSVLVTLGLGVAIVVAAVLAANVLG